jgi:hypothetical protein
MCKDVYAGGASALPGLKKKLKKSPRDKMVRPEQVKTK